MNKKQGYVKLYRSLWNNPIVCKDSDHIAVWIYLLTHATHSEMSAIFGNKKITLKAGQLITGRKAIAEKTGISESKIVRILKSFKNEQQIEQQTNSRGSLISILKWNEYQGSEQQTEQQVNNNWTTTEQQLNTNKNERMNKNEKMIKNDLFIKEPNEEPYDVLTCSYVSDEAKEKWKRLRKMGQQMRLNSY